MSRREHHSAASRRNRSLRHAVWFALLLGPIFVGFGLYQNYRDRPSLQWPKVRGSMMQSETRYHSGKSSYYDALVTYMYYVGDDRYVSHQMAVWSATLRGDGDRAEAFVAAHPAKSFVDVYYDPQHPERAVLIPGANEQANRIAIWGGSAIFVVSLYGLIRSRKIFARMDVDRKAL